MPYWPSVYSHDQSMRARTIRLQQPTLHLQAVRGPPVDRFGAPDEASVFEITKVQRSDRRVLSSLNPGDFRGASETLTHQDKVPWILESGRRCVKAARRQFAT